jgi:hypothetical protein
MKNDDELRNVTDREHLVVKTDDVRFLISIMEQQPSYDHRSFRIGAEGWGFVGHKSKEVALSKCPKCATSNYAMAVLSGCCAWCDFTLADYKETILEGMLK